MCVVVAAYAPDDLRLAREGRRGEKQGGKRENTGGLGNGPHTDELTELRLPIKQKMDFAPQVSHFVPRIGQFTPPVVPKTNPLDLRRAAISRFKLE